MRTRRVILPELAIGTITVLCLLTMALPAPAEISFIIETVDASGCMGATNSSLALDNLGRPRITYYDQVDGDLRYALKNGAEWQTEAVDSLGDVGQWNSLALDAVGGPHISYFDATVGDLKYATRPGDTWIIETVDATGDVGLSTAIALDLAGNPHIGYRRDRDNVHDDLKYARKLEGLWSIDNADSSQNDVATWTSIVVDVQGNPHISYFDTTPDELKYACRIGETWTIETVDIGNVGPHNSIQVDAEGNPHISYSADPGITCLKYARKVEGVWVVETVDSPANSVGFDSSLELDTNGNPHISYGDQTEGDLKYAYKTDDAWNIQAVDTQGSVGRCSSLELDAQSIAHISYRDATHGNLKYAVGTGAAGVAEEPGELPHVTLWQNTPNPFNPQTTITFELARPDHVHLWVCDASGSLIRIVLNGEEIGPGLHSVTWRGLTEHGARLASGVYFYRLVAGGFVETRRMTLIE